MIKRYKTVFCVFLTVFVALCFTGYSCKTSKVAVDVNDLSYMYNPFKSPVSPVFGVTVYSENMALLCVEFNEKDLFFSHANPEKVPAAQMLIEVQLYDETLGKVLIDTSAYQFSIIQEKNKSKYLFNIPLKISSGAKYVAEVRTLDRIRQLTHHYFVPFNTLSDKNRYDFKIMDNSSKDQLITPVVKSDEYINLQYLHGYPDSVYISFYKPFKSIPDPPSLLLPQKTIDYEPDTIITVPYSNNFIMRLPKEGVFHCRIDSNAREGITLYNFGNTFPNITDVASMVEPLMYLANTEELNTIRSAEKTKIAIDNFWLGLTGNIEKARELIRIYYSRVQYANKYFTSFTEGWRTERGMIYIIYGPPDKIYKTSDGENWGYRKPDIKSKWGNRYVVEENYIFFNFKKRNSVFSDNDFFLSRNESQVSNWGQAILNWRKGIVYRFDNPEEF